MIIIIQLIGAVATITALITFLGMKFVEWWECRKRGSGMTKEQKDKILKALAEDRNNYARDCTRRIAEENAKITGADYMLQRFLDILNAEVEPQESEE